jgi:hypothetical protein
VNSGRRPFVDESGRNALGANGLEDASFGVSTLEMLLSPLLDVVSTSYRESTDDEGGLGKDRPSMGRTISKNPSITKKSPEMTLVLVRTRGNDRITHLYPALQL